MGLRDKERSPGMFIAFGLGATLLLHVGVAGVAVYLARGSAEASKPAGPGIFVDAQLVRFGKPRDLSFLPHKEGVVKNKPDGLKIATDANVKPIDKKDRKDDPFAKAATDFNNLKNDDRPEAPAENVEGSLTGSRAGTAAVATGDPYILALMDQIGSPWKIPTTIKPEVLAKLTAEVCLTIDATGRLKHYEILTSSGNSQFDSSLDAALATVKDLPPPPDKWKRAAERGKLCPTFIPPNR